MQQLSNEILQKIAKEINLSTTGFILEKNYQDTYSKGQNIPISLIYASGESRGRVWGQEKCPLNGSVPLIEVIITKII